MDTGTTLPVRGAVTTAKLIGPGIPPASTLPTDMSGEGPETVEAPPPAAGKDVYRAPFVEYLWDLYRPLSFSSSSVNYFSLSST